MSDLPWRSLRQASKIAVGRNIELVVTGQHHVPEQGPGIIAARHFHHLYDGCAILATIPRPVHPVVALDWVQNPLGHKVMSALCSAAAWPVVYRSETNADPTNRTAQLRRAVRDAVRLLQNGKLLLVFPEGYPNIDPGFTPKQGHDDFLPFQPGFVQLGRAALGNDLASVPIIPAGFSYRESNGWKVDLRFGEPITLSRAGVIRLRVDEVEQRVRELSR